MDARIGIAAEVLHARIEQSIFRRGQFPIIQRDGAPHEFMPLREGQPGNFIEDFSEALG